MVILTTVNRPPVSGITAQYWSYAATDTVGVPAGLPLEDSRVLCFVRTLFEAAAGSRDADKRRPQLEAR